MTDFIPKKHRYIIAKEIRAVSIADALRREKHATIIEIREVYDDQEE